MLLGMIGLALVWLSQVPFRLAEVWWDRRYDQTDSGYVETLFANWLELGAEFLFVCFALVIVMALAGPFPRRWWLAAAPVFVGLGGALRVHLPVPLRDRAARRRRASPPTPRTYAREQGIEPVRIAVEDVTDFTSAPNAYAVGFGPTKRIVFWNTLLDGRFGDDEVKVVLAHELGHHSRDHIPEGDRLVRALRAPRRLADRASRRAGAAGWRTRRRCRSRCSCSSCSTCSRLPVYNSISRHMEEEADWTALETTRDPDGRGGLFAELHGRVAERSRSTDLVVPALRQPPLGRAADRDGRGVGSAP